MKRAAKENQVMVFNAKVWIERIGFNPDAVRVRLRSRDGWEMPIEFVSVASARAGLIGVANRFPWRASSVNDTIGALKNFA